MNNVCDNKLAVGIIMSSHYNILSNQTNILIEYYFYTFKLNVSHVKNV